MDFAKLAVFQASLGPQKPALGYTGGVATFGVLAGSAAQAIRELEALSLRPGDLVAVDVRNPFHHAALLLALALKGMASVSVQASLPIGACGIAVAAVLSDRFARPAPGVRTVAVDDRWFDYDTDRPVDFAALMALPGAADENAVMRVVFSSGVTGIPKAVGITPKVLARRVANAAFTYGGGSSHGMRVMSLMGFSTLPGFMSFLGTLAGGGMVCFAPNAAEALRIVDIFQVNLVSATVHQLEKLVTAQAAAPPPASLRTLIVGGSPMPPDLIAEAQARLCGNVMLSYGTTEVGSLVHANAASVDCASGDVGPPLPWVTIEIVDADREPLPRGRSGAIRVRSNETAAYLGATVRDVVEIGADWFYPGDTGTLRDNGVLRLQGRATEIINRGGLLVAPELVDRALVAHPSVAEAAAFGVTNARGVEEIWAAVVPRADYDPKVVSHFLRAALAEKSPDRLVVLGEIPRTEGGKIIRAELTQRARSGGFG